MKKNNLVSVIGFGMSATVITLYLTDIFIPYDKQSVLTFILPILIGIAVGQFCFILFKKLDKIAENLKK